MTNYLEKARNLYASTPKFGEGTENIMRGILVALIAIAERLQPVELRPVEVRIRRGAVDDAHTCVRGRFGGWANTRAGAKAIVEREDGSNFLAWAEQVQFLDRGRPECE
jgi:hypothetical protein